MLALLGRACNDERGRGREDCDDERSRGRDEHDDERGRDDKRHPSLTLRAGFRGTALVPFGDLVLESDDDGDDHRGRDTGPTRFEGTFFARNLRTTSNVEVKKLDTPFLLGSIQLTKTELCAGEETEVRVPGITDAPGTTVRIGTAVGAHQFLQFDGAPGTRFVSAGIVTADGRGDYTSVPVRVKACPRATNAPPRVGIHFRAALGRPNVIDFDVVQYDDRGFERPITSGASYQWTFGDGTTGVSESTLTTHNYSGAVDALAEVNSFTASVVVTTALGSVSARKVVPIWNLYAANRAKGVVQPPTQIRFEPGAYKMMLTNLEAAPLNVTGSRVDLVPCDPALPVVVQQVQPLSVVVPARSTGTVNVASSPKSPDVCGVNVHVFGSTAAGSVYSTAYGRIRENPLLVRRVTQSETIALLEQASAMTADPNRFDEIELKKLVAKGRLPSLPPAVAAGGTFADEGAECTPGEVSSPPGLVCQPTSDWMLVESSVINASRGEILVAHGCGPIGKLLASLNQKYSHEAIFTKRGIETRHSTAVADRFQNDVVINELKLNPRKMQYLFPGTDGKSTVVSVAQLLGSYSLEEPDDIGLPIKDRRRWTLDNALGVSRPTQCDGDFVAVPPLMIRPPPNAPPDRVQAIS